LLYLCWLFVVTVAFLYNTAAAPLRTAFFKSAVYNTTGTAPPPAASDVASVSTVCNSSVNANGTATVGVNSTAGHWNQSIPGQETDGIRYLVVFNARRDQIGCAFYQRRLCDDVAHR
jgi:hypothetical protein